MIAQELISFFQSRPEAEARVSEIVVSGGFTGVLLDNGRAGLAQNLLRGTTPSGEDLDFLWRMVGRPALDLASQSLAHGRLLVSAGVAALSALSQSYLEPDYLQANELRVERADFRRVLDHDLSAGARIGMVGFGGAVWQVARVAGQLVVTEAEPRFFRTHVVSQQGISEGPTGFRLVPTSRAQALLASCETVLISGCALAGQALDELLSACRNSRVIVYGPGTSLLPLPLFQYPQVAAVVTIRIVDGPGLINLLANMGPGTEPLLGEVGEALYVERAQVTASARFPAEAKVLGLPPLMDGRIRWDRGRQSASALRVLEPKGG
ncbi:MAG: DUF364 domain-containing protein [Clostridia bacterium]|jgi:uncharacterized protein (DUF4213/DUF364 family)|nr:DUF364 domain-containing protein [Clostridia bacterium]MDH7572972.1 DUF364 domain-containing protein [Clostridia bacterium]